MGALIHVHSGLRWLALALLFFAIVNAILKLKSGKYEKSDKMLNLFAMVLLHIQILIGTVLSFLTGKISYAEGWMKNPQYRFFGLEHILLMVIAVTLITIGRKKAERAIDPAKKHKTILIWYVIVLVIIFLAIPWPFRTALGGSWF
ncbi:cytochrome B [Fluviicola chungangensis]|uniref:Cytochrome B n=1 Tax=Fluviicola chungangensis TaxID=2597671 RepID=A0A556MPA7_9FLAO|nr:cytochrome B [Fluviicola chungangensis]TSJ41559.1 cytochrome B [Fluviicola chungangensis]